MNDYIISVDVSADIEKNFIETHEIHFVPMNYTVGDQELVYDAPKDDAEIKKIYDAQRKGDTTKTSQITPMKYMECFEPFLREGKDVLYISLSSGLTKTFDSANLAKRELAEKYEGAGVYPVDSVAATGGMGLLVELAFKNKEAGMSAKENADNLQEMSHKICHVFMVDDLMYLKRGGRISAATAVVGTMLNVKPILIMKPDGSLTGVRNKRGEKLALKDLAAQYLATRDLSISNRVYINHGDCRERVDKLIALIEKKSPGAQEFATSMLSPIIGAHTGPGLVVIAYFGDRTKI